MVFLLLLGVICAENSDNWTPKRRKNVFESTWEESSSSTDSPTENYRKKIGQSREKYPERGSLIPNGELRPVSAMRRKEDTNYNRYGSPKKRNNDDSTPNRRSGIQPRAKSPVVGRKYDDSEMEIKDYDTESDFAMGKERNLAGKYTQGRAGDKEENENKKTDINPKVTEARDSIGNIHQMLLEIDRRLQRVRNTLNSRP